MSKIAVLGDRDSVLGFRALGLEVVFADERDAAVHELHRLAREEYAIISNITSGDRNARFFLWDIRLKVRWAESSSTEQGMSICSAKA